MRDRGWRCWTALPAPTMRPCRRRFDDWNQVRHRIADLERDEHDRLRLLDLWSFQRKEIADARLQPEEDTKLEAEKRVLANAERVRNAAMAAYDALYDSNTSAAASIRAATRQIEELSRFDEQFRDAVPELESARITIEDIGATAARLRRRHRRLARAPGRGGRPAGGARPPEAQVWAEAGRRDRAGRRARAQAERDGEQGRGPAQAAPRAGATRRSSISKRRVRLSRQRYEAARKLEKLVESEINELAMKARFKVEVGGSDEEGNWTARGFDQVQYLISANPGEPLGPVDEIASGGELSRVMLALKTSCGSRTEQAQAVTNRVPHPPRRSWREGGIQCRSQRTLVFDEIDSGIGGRAAEAVGKKLKQLSRTKQVLCITHLPQIASFADQHYLIEKRESGGQNKDFGAAARCRRAHPRDRSHDERRQADRHVAEARRADAEGEPVVGSRLSVESKRMSSCVTRCSCRSSTQ